MPGALQGPGAAAPQTHMGLPWKAQTHWPVWPVLQPLPAAGVPAAPSYLSPLPVGASHSQFYPPFHLQTSTPSSRPLSGSMTSGRSGAATLSSCWWATRRTWLTRGRCRGWQAGPTLHASATPPGQGVLGCMGARSSGVHPLCLSSSHASWKGTGGLLEALKAPGRPLPVSSLRPHLALPAGAVPGCSSVCGLHGALCMVCMEPCAPGPAQQSTVWELATTSNTAAGSCRLLLVLCLCPVTCPHQCGCGSEGPGPTCQPQKFWSGAVSGCDPL